MQEMRVALDELAQKYEGEMTSYEEDMFAFMHKYGTEAFDALGVPPAPVIERRVSSKSMCGRGSNITGAQFLDRLQNDGFNILKHGKTGKPHARRVWLTRDMQTLNVSDSSGMGGKGVQMLDFINGHLSDSWSSAIFQRASQDGNIKDKSCCFSLITSKATLDIECLTKDDKNVLYAGLEKMRLLAAQDGLKKLGNEDSDGSHSD
jgi:hypothetical protein